MHLLRRASPTPIRTQIYQQRLQHTLNRARQLIWSMGLWRLNTDNRISKPGVLYFHREANHQSKPSPVNLLQNTSHAIYFTTSRCPAVNSPCNPCCKTVASIHIKCACSLSALRNQALRRLLPAGYDLAQLLSYLPSLIYLFRRRLAPGYIPTPTIGHEVWGSLYE